MALRLPPLSGLRLFEAAARCGSFKRAAQELNLTPGALSHGIDSLEQWLDVELFERKARGVILTPAGRQYLPYISEALSMIDARESVGIVDALTGELRRNGFVEGQNLAIEYRAWAPQMDLVSDYAADLAARPLDVFAVGGPIAVRAVQKATTTTPILAITDDMIGEGVVKSMARPDGNITGVSILATELDGKRQDILIEMVPGVRRIAAL